MAVVSLYPNYWDNGDGLRVKFPGSARTLARGGDYSTTTLHITEVFVPLASLATADITIVLENFVFPNGALIESVETLVTKETTTGGSPTFDFGFIKTDRATELDYNGLLAAVTAIGDGTDLGEKVTYVKGTSGAGALMGTQLAFDGILCANVNSTTFSAGTVRCRVSWSMQRSADV